ncbi:MAG: DnaB-like helicase N-terminal domain-containing protein, partial [Bilophila sp.]
MTRRVPPHSIEAESAVLAGLLLRPALMGSLAPILRQEDFYLPAHQHIYAAALDLYTHNAPIDLVTLAQRLKDRTTLELAGGTVYLSELALSAVGAANADYYAALVRDKAMQRGLIEAGAHIVSSAFDTTRELTTLLDEAEQAVMQLSSRTNAAGFKPVQALLGKVVDAVMSPAPGGVTGLATGYTELDAITRGLQP